MRSAVLEKGRGIWLTECIACCRNKKLAKQLNQEGLRAVIHITNDKEKVWQLRLKS
jgi:predicted RNA-binding protein YlxR (DUF448 family)